MKGIRGYHFSPSNKKIDDPQVLDDPKGISIGSMDVDNPNVYNDKSGLLLIYICHHFRSFCQSKTLLMTC